MILPKPDRTTSLMVLATLAVIALGLLYWQLVSRGTSDFQRCVAAMDSVQAQMPVATAVALMDRARPDVAPEPTAPNDTEGWSNLSGPVWALSCSYADPCDGRSLPSWLKLVVSPACKFGQTTPYGAGNFVKFEFNEHAGLINGTYREVCHATFGRFDGVISCFEP